MLRSHVFADALIALVLSLTLSGAAALHRTAPASAAKTNVVTPAVASERSMRNAIAAPKADPASAERPIVSAR